MEMNNTAEPGTTQKLIPLLIPLGVPAVGALIFAAGVVVRAMALAHIGAPNFSIDRELTFALGFFFMAPLGAWSLFLIAFISGVRNRDDAFRFLPIPLHVSCLLFAILLYAVLTGLGVTMWHLAPTLALALFSFVFSWIFRTWFLQFSAKLLLKLVKQSEKSKPTWSDPLTLKWREESLEPAVGLFIGGTERELLDLERRLQSLIVESNSSKAVLQDLLANCQKRFETSEANSEDVDAVNAAIDRISLKIQAADDKMRAESAKLTRLNKHLASASQDLLMAARGEMPTSLAIALVLGMLPVHLSIFSRTIVPQLPQSIGGLKPAEVRIVFRDNTPQITGQLISENNSVVLIRDTRLEGKTMLTLLPRENVKALYLSAE